METFFVRFANRCNIEKQQRMLWLLEAVRILNSVGRAHCSLGRVVDFPSRYPKGEPAHAKLFTDKRGRAVSRSHTCISEEKMQLVLYFLSPLCLHEQVWGGS